MEKKKYSGLECEYLNLLEENKKLNYYLSNFNKRESS